MKFSEMYPAITDLPEYFRSLDFPTPTGQSSDTLAIHFYNHFFYRETFTDVREVFEKKLIDILDTNLRLWKILLGRYDTIITGFAVPNDRRIVRNFPAPNGVPDTAHVLDMMEEEREGMGDENIERLIRVREFNNYWLEFLDKFEPLFIGVWQI
jgi:hypothetical protein